ncbi:succinylglutamate desuccinylase/aspartoacylase family protein [Facilibium subflavum]|uniref:succinylglutamate desuccinylase/aspartoacylase family protein n=1 Tax=Facilibium subflavum TaxID=2219058 RepID=UPI000E649DCD|nr:succinylglutamate desuccinylase/aspartoacylase family protein [Facilibium subflavum]
MRNANLKICDVNVHSGEKATLALPLPEQYSCSPMYMPIKVINGKQDGPCLLAFAMLDGNEFNGLEIVNQLFDSISANDLHGTLITVPALNVYGLTHYPKISPGGASISDSFPGDEHGNFSERIAYIFTEEILKKVDYCIELQTGSLNHQILPHVYCNFDDTQARKLAKAFQAPVITEVETGSSKLRQTTENLSIPLLVYEAGEAMRFDQESIQIGLEGIINVMRKLQMLEGEIEDKVSPVFSKDEDWLSSPSSGVLHTDVSLGESIKTGDKIGRLSDPFSNENATIVKSKLDGVVVGINRAPLIQEGASIFKVASFVDNERAEAALEEWEDLKPDAEE